MPTNRSFTGEPGRSQKDHDALERYRQWCAKLGIVPASDSTYIRVTAQHRPGILAWGGAK